MGYLGKQWVLWENNVFKSNVFDTALHTIYFDYNAFTFYQNKNYSSFT